MHKDPHASFAHFKLDCAPKVIIFSKKLYFQFTLKADRLCYLPVNVGNPGSFLMAKYES